MIRWALTLNSIPGAGYEYATYSTARFQLNSSKKNPKELNRLYAGIAAGRPVWWKRYRSPLRWDEDKGRHTIRMEFWNNHRLCWHRSRICALRTPWGALDCNICSWVHDKRMSKQPQADSSFIHHCYCHCWTDIIWFWELIGALEPYGLGAQPVCNNEHKSHNSATLKRKGWKIRAQEKVMIIFCNFHWKWMEGRNVSQSQTIILEEDDAEDKIFSYSLDKH